MAERVHTVDITLDWALLGTLSKLDRFDASCARKSGTGIYRQLSRLQIGPDSRETRHSFPDGEAHPGRVAHSKAHRKGRKGAGNYLLYQLADLFGANGLRFNK